MAVINGSFGLPEDAIDLILEEAAGEIPHLSSRFASPMHTMFVTSEWQKIASTRFSIMTVCRFWSEIGRRHCWGSMLLSYTLTIRSFTEALLHYPHHVLLVRRIAVLFDPSMIPDLIPLLKLFANNYDTSSFQQQADITIDTTREVLPIHKPKILELRIIDINSWDQSNPENWSELFDTISKLKTLQVLAFHGVDLVPPPSPSLLQNTQNMKILPYLRTLESSLPVKGVHFTHDAIPNPVPVAAFVYAFQKRMTLPYLSRLIIRDLDHDKFGDELLNFLEGFKNTLRYLALEISDPPQKMSSLAHRFKRIEMPNLVHLEISFPYQSSLLEVIHPESLQVITINSVHRICRSNPHHEPSIDRRQADSLGAYTLSDLFSCIHDLLLAPGEDGDKYGNECNTNIPRVPLKNVFLNELRVQVIASQEGLEYWNSLITTADQWVNTLDEKYGVTVLARSVRPREDSMLRFVDPTIANFRPVVKLIAELFEKWVNDIKRLHAYHQSVSNSQQEQGENGDVEEAEG